MGAALITGSSRGIGRACAELFARRGLDVVVHYRRDAEAARAVVAAVEAHGRRAVAVRAELADADEVAGLADAAIEAFGTLDVVVANAAASAFKPLTELRSHHIGATLDTIVASFLHLVRETQPALRAPGGRIVTVSGFDTVRVLENHGLLAAAKAALEQLTRYLAVELAPRAVTVNCVVPGYVDTDSARIYAESTFPGGWEAARAEWAARTPLGRIAAAEEIAAVVGLLCSEDAAWITGQVIVADGGVTIL